MNSKPMVAAAIVMAAAAVSSSVHADETVWGYASQPERRVEAQLLTQIDALMSEFIHLRERPLSLRRSLVLNRARRILERTAIHRSKVPAVRHRVAMVYYRLFDVERQSSLLRQAIPHFEMVATSRAPVSVRAQVLNNLAICHARLGDHAQEVRAYARALAIEPDPAAHAILLANQAEGYMGQGRILRALRGYRASLAQTPGAMMLDSGVTTLWGLAVALDRSGDLDGALEQVAAARAYDPNDRSINGPTWFYVPPYDKHWYRALGHWQTARSSDDPAAQLAAYDSAIASWRAYLDNAVPNDHWLALAETRLRQCEQQLARATKGHGDAPAPPAAANLPRRRR